ncbi:MAG: hypothetical protein HRU41_32825 [Saprospiraceae bacterium]|nr:hypothetical protein [Saprospiraceae bacterium]
MLSPDFREFLSLLLQYQVKFLITGGYAVGVYGHPRYTGDIDIWVDADLENGQKLVAVFEDFGLKSFGIKAKHFMQPNQVIQIGYPPFRIDILTSIDGVSFAEAYPNKEVIEIDGLALYFISLTDLAKNKKSTGRGIDLDDLKNLGIDPEE